MEVGEHELVDFGELGGGADGDTLEIALAEVDVREVVGGVVGVDDLELEGAALFHHALEHLGLVGEGGAVLAGGDPADLGLEAVRKAGCGEELLRFGDVVGEVLRGFAHLRALRVDPEAFPAGGDVAVVADFEGVALGLVLAGVAKGIDPGVAVDHHRGGLADAGVAEGGIGLEAEVGHPVGAAHGVLVEQQVREVLLLLDDVVLGGGELPDLLGPELGEAGGVLGDDGVVVAVQEDVLRGPVVRVLAVFELHAALVVREGEGAAGAGLVLRVVPAIGFARHDLQIPRVGERGEQRRVRELGGEDDGVLVRRLAADDGARRVIGQHHQVLAGGAEGGELLPGEDDVVGIDGALVQGRLVLPDRVRAELEDELGRFGLLPLLGEVGLDFALGGDAQAGLVLGQARVDVGAHDVRREGGRGERVQVGDVGGGVAGVDAAGNGLGGGIGALPEDALHFLLLLLDGLAAAVAAVVVIAAAAADEAEGGDAGGAGGEAGERAPA